jgi:NAD(P)-dependent dehydrogenase (short-subunit alcohol dehydrogenase family)
MSMAGKLVVVTGATSGIGEVAALSLAGQGARVVFVARDRARGDATLANLKAANSSADHKMHLGDLSSISEMKRVANEITARESRIDVLINNAGAVFLSRKTSVDHLEMTFATNHMAYFVLTNILLDRLKATPGARIVSTASDAHKSGKVDFADLQSEKNYSSFRVYGTSKLENILFTRQLSKRLAGTGVTANCLHPGFVGTRFGQNNASNIFLKGLARGIMAFGLKPEEGAKTIIYLASSPEVEANSGGYYYKCKLEQPTAAAQNDEDARRLWEASEKIAGFA